MELPVVDTPVVQDNTLLASGESLQRPAQYDNLRLIAGGMSHAFNNFLQPITGYAQFIDMDCSDNPDIKQMNDRIRNSAQMVAETIRLLKGFSMDPTNVDKVVLLYKSIGMVHPEISSQAAINTDISEEDARSLVGSLTAFLHDHFQLINTYADLVSGCTESLPEIHDMASEIVKAGRRAAIVIERLKVYCGDIEVVPQRMELWNTIVTTIRDIQVSSKGLKFNLNPSDGLLPAYVDPKYTGIAIKELIINAVEASPIEGEIEITSGNRIVTSDNPKESKIIPPGVYSTITVHNSGKGIPAEEQARLFWPFNTDNTKPGKGLGLALAYGIMRQLKGGISVESSSTQGTTVTLYFPQPSLHDQWN